MCNKIVLSHDTPKTEILERQDNNKSLGHRIMYSLSKILRSLTGRSVIRKPQAVLGCVRSQGYADKSKPDVASKEVMVQGTANERSVRVRRARPADVPRVLRFVREHAACAWPGLVPPRANTQLVLCDYVARALAQGHSMLAEQQESKRGFSQIRGLAIGAAICPWDATLLEKWASCVKCSRSRKLMYFTAHCLRAPGLYDKYRVHNILQVILIVPPDTPNNAEIIQVLVKNIIKRGKDAGFPLLRFDVSDDISAKTLEDLKLKKEWQQCYEIVPKKTAVESVATGVNQTNVEKGPEHILAVYTALTMNLKDEKDT